MPALTAAYAVMRKNLYLGAVSDGARVTPSRKEIQMSEEPKAREKPETQKAWFNGPLKLSPSADPAKFPWLPDPATIQRIEEMQRTSQSWQKLMGPTLASFNEINQRFAEAFGGYTD
jgi:hypothetical protein